MVVLIVEDNSAHRRFLVAACEELSHSVVEAGCCHDVIKLPQLATVGAALIDVQLPDGSGLELTRPLLERNPAMRVFILTGYPAVAGAVYAMKLGAADYLPKPVSVATLEHALAGEFRRDQTLTGPARTLEQAEWDFINEVLVQCNGNISEAARRLGIHRQSLQRKLKKPPR